MPFEHVLLLLKGYLGDAVMLTPLLKGLVETGAAVEAYTDPGVIALLEYSFPGVTFHRSRNIRNPFELLKERSDIRSQHYDAAIVVNRSFRSALLASLAGVPVRVGHDTDRRAFLLTHSVPYYLDRSESDSCMDLAEAVGLHLPHSHPSLSVPAELAAELRPCLEGAEIGIQPGARHAFKQLPIAVMAEVCEGLHHDGRKLVLLGGDDERAAGKELESSLSFKPLNLIGDLSLKESMAAASLLSLVVGGDTGFMHIAAAVGAPTVAAFGETSAAKWGHHYAPHKVLVSPTKNIRDFAAGEILDAARAALSAT